MSVQREHKYQISLWTTPRRVITAPRDISVNHTVNPTKRIHVWKLHPAKRAQGQRTCVHWKSVCRVYKSVNLLTDVSFISLYLACQSVICTYKLWRFQSNAAKDRTTVLHMYVQSWEILLSKVFPAGLELTSFWSWSSTLHLYTKYVSWWRDEI